MNFKDVIFYILCILVLCITLNSISNYYTNYYNNLIKENNRYYENQITDLELQLQIQISLNNEYVDNCNEKIEYLNRNLLNSTDNCKKAIESYKMYNTNELIKNSKADYGIYGLAFLDEGFYCISYHSINMTETEQHEIAHFYIQQNKYHFCEE